MNMPKSRGIHAKIPLPKAILLNFGFVSVKILNRYGIFLSICQKTATPCFHEITASFSASFFKNASAFLLRDARHAMHDILLLRISAILLEAISDED